MSKRKATNEEIAAAPVLAVALPKSTHPSDPFSWGDVPELYTVDGLKKVAVTKHLRIDEFEKRVIAIWWASGEASVPFIFRTADGTIRSLDAGCVGFLVNRWQTDCDVVEDASGYVTAIVPTQSMVSRYEPIKDRLMDIISLKP